MAAITRTAASPRPAQPAPPHLRLVLGGAHPRRRAHAARRLHPSVYRRRRLVAVLLLVTVVALLSTLLTAVTGPGGAGDGTAVGAGAPSGPATYVVRHGDSLWSVARDLQPSGDVRPLVDALADANGGPVVRPGDVLVLP